MLQIYSLYLKHSCGPNASRECARCKGGLLPAQQNSWVWDQGRKEAVHPLTPLLASRRDRLGSGGLGSVRLTVGLDDLKGLFQPKRFYDFRLHVGRRMEPAMGSGPLCTHTGLPTSYSTYQ